MRYLTFDIECCNGRDICEFGYVITNTDFEILEQKNITINPEKKFDLGGRIELHYSEEEYYASPLFTAYYEEIKALLEYEDQIVIGHSVGNDAGFLRNACKHYRLEPINFAFFDSQKLYAEFFNQKGPVSLEDAGTVFDIEKPNYLHKADEDAALTMQLVKSMCNALEVSLSECMSLCPNATGSAHNFNIKYTGSDLAVMLQMFDTNPDLLSNNKKELCVRKFSEKVRSEGKIIKNEITGKVFCFSSHFEKHSGRNAIVLMQMLANHGASYALKVSQANYYVMESGEEDDETVNNCVRLHHVHIANAEGAKIEVIPMDKLLNWLGVTMTEVSTAPMPSVPKKTDYSAYAPKQTCTTVGELLKSQGIDLMSLFATK